MAEVELRDVGSARVITLNRPAQRNAVDAATATLLETAVKELDADTSISVGILTGAGGYFSAGMDLKAFTRGEVPVTSEGGFAGFVRRPPEKPIIAAVEGWALAGGCELALACDLIVASADARFGLPEVKRGLVAGGGGLIRIASSLPHQRAMELILTGEPITAAEASSLGLVNRVAAPGSALDVALELAATIAENGPLALRVSKSIALNASDYLSPAKYDEQRSSARQVFDSADAMEGALAFAEQRKPKWVGA